VPFLETVGNPNIVYQSVLRQPEGERVSCFWPVSYYGLRFGANTVM
jgi:hypothetical protein